MGIQYRNLAFLCHCSCGETFFTLVPTANLGEAVITTCPACSSRQKVKRIPKSLNMHINCGERTYVSTQTYSGEGPVAQDILDAYRTQLSTTRAALFTLESAVRRALRVWKHRHDRPHAMQEAVVKLLRALKNVRQADIARQEIFNKVR